MIMMIAPSFRARKEGKKRGEALGEFGRIWGEDEGNADYGRMVQPSQQHVAPYVMGLEWGLGMGGLRIVAAFWANIPVSSA